jgi:hypothetical protein
MIDHLAIVIFSSSPSRPVSVVIDVYASAVYFAFLLLNATCNYEIFIFFFILLAECALASPSDLCFRILLRFVCWQNRRKAAADMGERRTASGLANAVFKCSSAVELEDVLLLSSLRARLLLPPRDSAEHVFALFLHLAFPPFAAAGCCMLNVARAKRARKRRTRRLRKEKKKTKNHIRNSRFPSPLRRPFRWLSLSLFRSSKWVLLITYQYSTWRYFINIDIRCISRLPPPRLRLRLSCVRFLYQ